MQAIEREQKVIYEASTLSIADVLGFGSDDGYIFQSPEYSISGSNKCSVIDIPDGLETENLSNFIDQSLGDSVIRGAIYKSGHEKKEGPNCLPIVLAAFDFEGGQPTQCFVPDEVLLRYRDGSGMLIRQKQDSKGTESIKYHKGTLSTPNPPEEFHLSSNISHSDFKDLIIKAVSKIVAGEFDKVVLAREITIKADRKFQPSVILERLNSLFPSCAIFSIDGFVGASPELLIKKSGSMIKAKPLAGTTGRSGDEKSDNDAIEKLLNSQKNQEEHGFVVKEILSSLTGFCKEIDTSPKPEIVSLRNVCHLATDISGLLIDPDISILELVRMIHPTPAVGGYPRQPAKQAISEFENFSRGRYAGAVGWFDGSGDGEWYVGIRSAQLQGTTAKIMAGVGIVKDSDSESELIETQLKFQAMLSAIVRP
ncbi:MAG: isochorismate synthase [Acidimicrobiales bacterium]|nr:isochorismate synthase [Acidimicrobiales bacterium]